MQERGSRQPNPAAGELYKSQKALRQFCISSRNPSVLLELEKKILHYMPFLVLHIITIPWRSCIGPWWYAYRAAPLLYQISNRFGSISLISIKIVPVRSTLLMHLAAIVLSSTFPAEILNRLKIPDPAKHVQEWIQWRRSHQATAMWFHWLRHSLA